MFWFNFIAKQRLAKHYNIPHIVIKNVVEHYLKIEGEEGDRIREEFEGMKAESVEKARIDYEAD